ncbi:PREDICTED: zinc finger protein 239-like isoform X1 [Papilio xuthus]|uniref:Zinc finger protein 239-like isoform X1 n=1 Tax=Papilio xuthus TaxID=66420 RepID=A0AAJ6Z9E2_PAPXU|nr:PREDICTED: zinc finger protein 239-like isoform X1 [Papilio xuthus]
MDKCAICLKPAVQLFETGKDGVYACFKCQPLVPEVTIGDHPSEATEPKSSKTIEVSIDSIGLNCDICEKSFQKNTQLQSHLRNHLAERRFVCTYCNKAFSQSNNLRAHLRIHTNERPYKCSECGKAFTQVTNLNNHVRLHTGERPYVCPEEGCGKAYAQVTNLNQHRKRHLSGPAPKPGYDCPICGESFQQRNHMHTHRRTVHEVPSEVGKKSKSSRLSCGVCGEVQPGSSALRHHLASHVHDSDNDDKRVYSCVFSSCGERFMSPGQHTEHLLRAHQLRVMTARAPHPPRRGRPPKVSRDMFDPEENSMYDEVKIIKQETQYSPKLKVQSLFQ